VTAGVMVVIAAICIPLLQSKLWLEQEWKHWVPVRLLLAIAVSWSL
jgi:hypothetical protein